MNTLLEIHDVTKRFGGVVANDTISFDVKKGEIMGLIGPNGSGKSTLFGCLSGVLPVDGGEIKFEGKTLSKLLVSDIARLGLLRTYQHTHVYGELTCTENMAISSRDAQKGALHLLLHGQKTPKDADDLLAFVGLFEKRHDKAGSLSFGQQKLLEFAMALMCKPKLLLLDEPTAGINPTLINHLMEKLVAANRDLSITLLVIEHNMRVIMSLADRLACMAQGQLLALGSPNDVRNDPRVLEAYLGSA